MTKHNHNDNSLPYVSTIKKTQQPFIPRLLLKIHRDRTTSTKKKSVTLHSLFQSSPNPTIRHNYHFRCSYSYAIEQEKAINVRRSCRQNRQGKAAASSGVGEGETQQTGMCQKMLTFVINHPWIVLIISG